MQGMTLYNSRWTRIPAMFTESAPSSYVYAETITGGSVYPSNGIGCILARCTGKFRSSEYLTGSVPEYDCHKRCILSP